MHPKLSRNASENLAIETRIKETNRVLECILPHHFLVRGVRLRKFFRPEQRSNCYLQSISAK